jgi:replicative superfamily II helicase
LSYIEITQKEFEDVLTKNGYKWEMVKDSYAKETVYLINSNGIFVKIFSSIENGVSRPVGADAVRIVAWDPVSGLPVMGSEGRVNRTDGWRENLVARIETVRSKMVGVEKCKICGGIMVERTNSKTKDKFLGCLNWKGHQNNDTNVGKESVKRVDIGKILEKINRKSIVTSMATNGTIVAPAIAADILGKDVWNNLSAGWKDSIIAHINTIRSGNSSDGRDIAVVHKPIEEIGSKNPPCTYESSSRIGAGNDGGRSSGSNSGSNNTGTKDIISSFHDEMKGQSERLHIRFQEVVGNEPLLETKLFKWGNFPMDKFNPIQSRLIEFVSGDNNVVVEAKTSTGKTVMGEMFMWKVLQEGKKIIYTSPLKALTREKWDSWTKRFGDKGYKIAIVTGDYRLTDKRIKELNEAHIILCTSEMLDHRTRNMTSEKSEWLAKAGLLILDEVQMIGMKDRGDKLEAGLMRFTLINPTCRLILLSGTMPNSGEISGWIRDLNGKDTILVKSGWRPIKLNMKYESYDDSGSYYDAKFAMFGTVINEVKKHDHDKILIFVHSKTDGRKLMTMLGDLGYTVEFHNADLEADERVNIEESFKNKEGGVRIIIATSTLAYGLNLPARVVIIAGMHRGLEEVSELDIVQMCGRSGRMGIDAEGDAIMVFPRRKLEEYKRMIEDPGDIMSQINNPVIAAFHVIGEIATKSIKTKEDVHKWYSRTLAIRQGEKMDKEYVDQLVDYLLQNNAIRDVNGQLVETELGKAAVYFYLRPDMLKDLMVNWTKIFEVGVENNDFIVSLAMSKLRMYQDVIVSKADRSEIEQYHKASKAMVGTLGEIEEGQAKIGMAYLNMLRGIGGTKVIDGKKVANPLAGVQRGLSQDIERVAQAVMYIDAKYARWGKGTFWSGMALRFKYGIGPELISLCRLEGIGGVYARKLYDAGIRQPTDLVTKKRDSIMVLGAKYDGIVTKNEEMFRILGYDIRKEYT